MAQGLTHLDKDGSLRMVDVSRKKISHRQAWARGEICMQPETLKLIVANKTAKGNALEAARLAGIMAAKRTGDLIPLCHQLNLTAVEIEFAVGADRIEVEAQARVDAGTGVEMEALTAATVALLTIYDMCKKVDRGMVISRVCLVENRGGARGTYVRDEGQG